MGQSVVRIELILSTMRRC